MVNPVLSRIQGQREVMNVVHIDVVVKMNEYAQARCRKKSMRWSLENVKAGNIIGYCDAIRGQIFFHREVRELDNFLVTDVDNSNQSGTSRQYEFFWILGTQTSIECGDGFHIGSNCKKFCELLDTKRTLGYDQALEKTIGVVPFLFVDPPEGMLVSSIQGLR